MASSFILLSWLVLFLSIVYTDFKERIVSNYQVLIVFLISIIGSYVYNYELNWLSFLLVFFIGFLLWKVGFLGAGDIKLMMAFILSIPYDKLTLFFLIMSVAGFFIAVAVLILKIKQGVPYAPAIAFSHLFIFYDLFLV